MKSHIFFKKGSRSLRNVFLLRYFTNYFLYGYLLLAVVALSVFSSALAFSSGRIIAFFIFAVSAVTAAIFFLKLVFTSREKWRYWRISRYRLLTRSFSEDWFKFEMSAPCYRLMIRDLCYEFGYIAEYERMKRLYSSRRVTLEMQKERLVARVLARKEHEKFLKEVGQNELQS